MTNMKLTKLDGKLLIEIDLSHKGTQTSRGNTMLAGTSNWEKIEEVPGLSINMAVVLSKKAGQ